MRFLGSIMRHDVIKEQFQLSKEMDRGNYPRRQLSKEMEQVENNLVEFNARWQCLVTWSVGDEKIWCCQSTVCNMPAYLENLAVVTGLEKVSFPSNPTERQCQRIFKLLNSSNMLAKSCSKFSKIRLQQYVKWELPDVEAGFRKGRETRNQIANIHSIIEKAREFQEKKQNKTKKHIYFASLTMVQPLTLWIITNCGKFLWS